MAVHERNGLREDWVMKNSALVNDMMGDVTDFDFLVGSWIVLNRRLVTRGVGCTEWDEFSATYRCQQYLDGVANVDEMLVPSKGFSGMTLRTFDIAARRWAIYWINSGNGILCPPVFGGFNGNRGDFYGTDIADGKPVAVHFVWQRYGVDEARWYQEFSSDGEVWETNWIMEFTRVHPSAP